MKSLLMSFIAIFVFVNVFGLGLLIPSPAHAQMDSAITAAFTGKWAWEKVETTLLSAGLGALVNGASYFMRKLAYDGAKFVASGGKGQGALAFKEGFGSYLSNTALDSAAGAIEQLGEPFGFNLCKPPDLRVQVSLQLGFSSIYKDQYGSNGEGGPQPRCNWNDLRNNWENGKYQELSNASGKDIVSSMFASSLDVQQSDFGFALDARSKIDRLIAGVVAGAEKTRDEGGGFKAVTDLISGDIKTPAEVIKEETKAVTAKHQGELNAQQVAGIYGSGAAQILPMALSVFFNTLTSQLLQNVFQKGILSGSGDEPAANGVINEYASVLNYNRQEAERAFSYLIAAIPKQDLTSYDAVAEFYACPDRPGLRNCVIDSGLMDAIGRAKVGDPLTIAQALDQGLLHEDWPLVSSLDQVNNTNLSYCQNNAYCFSNLQKLRQLRIFPLGFELAALKSSPDQPFRLGEVVRGYRDCGDASQGYDEKHKFCHLIDPDWVIKAPEARCETKVYGEQLMITEAPERREECVDISTCLAHDELGQCSGYGYCTREKNIWRFNGDSCPDYLNTCSSFTARDGKLTSYLSRTLDFGMCTKESVGCRAYSTERVLNDWWRSSFIYSAAWKKIGRTQVLYFNDEIKNNTCPAEADGCSLFYTQDGLQTSKKYIKKAPNYLSCYDLNTSTPEIDWPKSKADITAFNSKSRSSDCSQFAQVCIPEEVGCKSYTPVDGGGPDVAGIVGSNTCLAECVGYETFKQEETHFEKSEFPLYFIGRNAKVCSAQYEGCDEFTNIDTVAKGGEGLEYYSNLKYCERPNGTNEKTYYSWEGSENEGYVLRKHRMLQISDVERQYVESLQLDPEVLNEFEASSPAYNDDSKSGLEGSYALCNKEKYNALINNPYSLNVASSDCRALYDNSGHIYYRLLANTVTVSDACHPLRKTLSNLYVDNELTAAGSGQCSAKGGVWKGSACERCYNGGSFEDGSCVYWTIPDESDVCPASANMCRSYIGNKGNNIQEVLFSSFEPASQEIDALNAAKSGWWGTRALSVEPEATQVGLYSLKIDSYADLTFGSEVLQANAWYELSFWARGVPQSLSIAFAQDGRTLEQGNFTFDVVRRQEVPAPVTSEWQEYRLGPVQFTGTSSSSAKLSFDRTLLSGASSGAYFLDNIRLVRYWDDENRGQLYAIKNSWKTLEGYDVPLSCDSSPDDPYPGAALGCRAYNEKEGGVVNITSFGRLCRPEAVGCRELVDSFNSEDEGMTAYNIECRQGANVARLADEALKCLVNFEDSEYSCTVTKQTKSCFVNVANGDKSLKVEIPDNYEIERSGYIHPTSTSDVQLTTKDALYVVTSTVVIPADSDSVYLTDRNEFSCNSSFMGCQKLGLEERTLPTKNQLSAFSYSDAFVLNNPALYDSVLCNEFHVGCEEFTSNGSVSFFKDPQLTGQSYCSYRTEVQDANGNTRSGWYREGVGSCSSTPAFVCRTDADCPDKDTCNPKSIGTIPCYSNYVIQSGLHSGEYGLWSNGSPGYQGFVGKCQDKMSGCSELIDRADTTDAVNSSTGKAYYVIDNNNLHSQDSECNGKASQKEGCILFDMTKNPNKFYNTKATYGRSELANPPYSLVETDQKTPPLDANVLIKVERDRECGEWLMCKTADVIYDDSEVPRQICNEYKKCGSLGVNGECIDWQDEEADNAVGILDVHEYVKRGTGWGDKEYVGYSLPNKYDINNYLYFSLASSTYLGFEDVNSKGNCLNSGDTVNRKCGANNKGRCIEERCVFPLSGSFNASSTIETASDIARYLQPISCKAYPEADSPYQFSLVIPSSATKLVPDMMGKGVPSPASQTEQDAFVSGSIPWRRNFLELRKEYQNVHVCQDEGGCMCDYIKIEYGNGVTDYWSKQYVDQNRSMIPEGVCVGGKTSAADGNKSFDGNPCSTNDDCKSTNGESGTCNLISKRTTSLGMKNFCLEYDLSRPLGQTRNSAGALQTVFPCLTWMPVQQSISNVDVFNSNPNAGYNPIGVDAPNGGGTLYCTNSSGTGGGLFDSVSDNVLRGASATDINSLSSYPMGDATILLSTYHIRYSSDGLTENNDNGPYGIFQRQVDLSWNGESTPDGVRQSLDLPRASGIADDFHAYLNPSFGGYAQLQIWGWRNIGINARLLRYNYGDCRNLISPLGNNTYAMYSFAPMTHYGSAHTCTGGDYDPIDINQQGDMGTAMHPPRLWGCVPDSSLSQNANNSFVIQSINTRNPYNLDTTALSPEATVPAYISPVEKDLWEQNIESVYFVPIQFQDQENSDEIIGLLPALMTNQFKINIAMLRTFGDKKAESTGLVSTLDGNHLNRLGVISGDEDDWSKGRTNGKLQLYTYVLDRENDGGLLSYYNYSATDLHAQGTVWEAYRNYPDVSGGITNSCRNNMDRDEFERRNRIAHRYVAVYYNKDLDETLIPFIPADPESPPTDASKDPFTAECRWEKSKSNDWLAIGMDFNEDGEFLGYISRWCNGYYSSGNDDSAGIQFAVYATMMDRCERFVSVYNDREIDTLTNGTNKAWTDRVWIGAQQTPVGVDRWYPHLPLNLDAQPFGSLAKMPQDMASREVRNTYNFTDPDKAHGYPYSCSVLANRIFMSNAWCDHLINSINRSDNTLPTAEEIRENTSAGFYDAEDSIHELFAKFYGRSTPAAEQGIACDSTFFPCDVSSSTTNGTRPPQIYSVNPDPNKCPDDGSGKCALGLPNSITINKRNSVLTDFKTAGQNDSWEVAMDGVNVKPVILRSIRTATMKFYAFADDNHMPIRRVLIDWGDGTPVKDQMGFYKNRKPYCESSDSGGAPTVSRCMVRDNNNPIYTQVTCKEESGAADECGNLGFDYECADPQGHSRHFGDSVRACEPRPFESIHNYSCSVAMSEGDEFGRRVGSFPEYVQQELMVYGKGAEDMVCVFRPRVQVLDNWGWCNGTEGVTVNSGKIVVPQNAVSKGVYNDDMNGSCTDGRPDTWTYYKGEIIVIPN